MSVQDSSPCPHCLVGRMHLRLITYVHVYNDTMVSVPNTPAWKCDFCHAVEYDVDALMRIEALVGEAGPPPNHYRPAAQRPPALGTPRLGRGGAKQDR